MPEHVLVLSVDRLIDLKSKLRIKSLRSVAEAMGLKLERGFYSTLMVKGLTYPDGKQCHRCVDIGKCAFDAIKNRDKNIVCPKS